MCSAPFRCSPASHCCKGGRTDVIFVGADSGVLCCHRVLCNLVSGPREQYVYSGLCGAAGWLCYLLVMQNYPSPAVASFAAVVVLTVMSRIFAVRRKTPVTVFLICGIFPLVPGAGIYYTAYNFIIGNNQMAVAKGVETIKIAVAIALAVVFTFSLPTPVFRFAKSRKGR